MHNIKTVKHVLIVFMLLISITFAQAKEMKEHKVVKGDTLWDLSAKELNDPFLWSDIWMVNLWIKDPDLIYPNQTIKLPLYLARVQPRDEQVTPAPAPAPAPAMAKAIEEPVRQEDERAAVATKLTTVVEEPVVPKETPREEDTPKPVAVAQKPATVKAVKEIAQKKQPLPIGLNQFVASGYMADTIPAVGWVGKSTSGLTLFGSYDNLPVVLDQPGRVG
ncbi:MAG: LysM peptidoglycan-binding domain-containing protein, partial [Smithellaceae bacterium]